MLAKKPCYLSLKYIDIIQKSLELSIKLLLISDLDTKRDKFYQIRSLKKIISELEHYKNTNIHWERVGKAKMIDAHSKQVKADIKIAKKLDVIINKLRIILDKEYNNIDIRDLNKLAKIIIELEIMCTCYRPVKK